jgi:multidrug resistance efflux pump
MPIDQPDTNGAGLESISAGARGTDHENGAGPDSTSPAAWVPDDPAGGHPASARVKIAEPSSRASTRELERVSPAPYTPRLSAAAGQTNQGRPHAARRSTTWPQRIGGLLIAATCVGLAAWYVPDVLTTNRQQFTGAVLSRGIITLNFPDKAQIKRINVHPGQTVHRGQVLATQVAPDATTVVKAELASIAADKAKIAQLRSQQAQGQLNAGSAVPQLVAAASQLRFDVAQLSADKAKLAATRITAPAPGTVVAANGQPGQVASPTGIRDYATNSPSSSAEQKPTFSLLPEGPQPLHSSSPRASSLPVIALRTSEDWSVEALIPENSISRVAPGKTVRISVPSAGIKHVRGVITQLSPSPISTREGTAYQVEITITGHVRHEPVNGMAANVQLGR